MPTVDLFHGTTLDRAEAIARSGFRHPVLHAELEAFAALHGLTAADLVPSTGLLQAEGRDACWFTPCLQQAERWSQQGPEFLDELERALAVLQGQIDAAPRADRGAEDTDRLDRRLATRRAVVHVRLDVDAYESSIAEGEEPPPIGLWPEQVAAGVPVQIPLRPGPPATAVVAVQEVPRRIGWPDAARLLGVEPRTFRDMQKSGAIGEPGGAWPTRHHAWFRYERVPAWRTSPPVGEADR